MSHIIKHVHERREVPVDVEDTNEVRLALLRVALERVVEAHDEPVKQLRVQRLQQYIIKVISYDII